MLFLYNGYLDSNQCLNLAGGYTNQTFSPNRAGFYEFCPKQCCDFLRLMLPNDIFRCLRSNIGILNDTHSFFETAKGYSDRFCRFLVSLNSF